MADPESIKVPSGILLSNPVSKSVPELADALATAEVLRATARAARGAPTTLGPRLYRAADTLDAVVALSIRCLERIERLEQEVRRLLGGAQ